MILTYMIIFYNSLNDKFLFWNSVNLFTYSNKSNRFDLKMESDEEIVAAIVDLVLVQKNQKKGFLSGRHNSNRIFII